MIEWIECKERLPDISKEVFVKDKKRIRISYRLNPKIVPSCTEPYFCCACSDSCPRWSTSVTHWAELPEGLTSGL